MTEHVPRHVLEEIVARPNSPELASYAAHLSGCPHCLRRQQALARARQQFLASRSASAFARAAVERAAVGRAEPAKVLRSARPSRRVFAFGVAAAAAAAALVSLSMPDGNAVRLKSASGLEVYVQRSERAELLRDGDSLRAGDRLGFVYTLGAPRHVLLFGIDDAGVISRYFPAEGGAAALAAGRAQLPLAVELDGRRGQERMIALFSARPIDEAAARAALAAAYRTAPGRALDLSAPPRLELPVEHAGVWFRKP